MTQATARFYWELDRKAARFVVYDRRAPSDANAVAWFSHAGYAQMFVNEANRRLDVQPSNA